MKLKPSELWTLSACELVDMQEASVDFINEELDTEMQRTSWFTSLLMNASGNFKKQIKPEKLYVPNAKQTTPTAEKQVDYVENQREELRKKFNIE